MKESDINALRNEALNDQQRALAKLQLCGCVICTCENELKCQGCGAKHCGKHPVSEFEEPIYDKIPRPAKAYPGAMADCKAVSGHKELENLANELRGWGSIKHCWKGDDSEWIVGHIDEDDRTYPLFEIDAGNYDAPDDSGKLAKFYAACNPSAISSMLASISALEAENAELKESNELLAKEIKCLERNEVIHVELVRELSSEIARLEALVPNIPLATDEQKLAGWILEFHWLKNLTNQIAEDHDLNVVIEESELIICQALNIPHPPKGESQ